MLEQSQCEDNPACTWINYPGTQAPECRYTGPAQVSCMQDSTPYYSATTLSLTYTNITVSDGVYPCGTAVSGVISLNACGQCKACYGELLPNGRRYQIAEECCSSGLFQPGVSESGLANVALGIGGSSCSRVNISQAYIVSGNETGSFVCHGDNPSETTTLRSPMNYFQASTADAPPDGLSVVGIYYHCNATAGPMLNSSICDTYPHCIAPVPNISPCLPKNTANCPMSPNVYFGTLS